MQLMIIFFFECPAKVLLQKHFPNEVTFMRLQVGKGLVKLAHEDCIVCFSEVRMGVSTELVVTIDGMADAAH